MKLLLAGHSMIDLINYGNKIFQLPGGIIYSAAALNAVTAKEDEKFLITEVEENNFSLFAEIYDNYQFPSGIFAENQPEVELILHENSERDEKYNHIGGELNFPAPEFIENFDGILLNMITGFDITISTLEKIREKFSGYIYLDIHTLSRGVDKTGKRKFRKIPEIERWLNAADIVQANESELKTIADNGMTTHEAADYILSRGPGIFINTRGARGVVIYYKNPEGKITIEKIKPEKIHSANQVGCGDVFGALFFYFYILTGDISLSAKRAVKGGEICAEINPIKYYYRFVNALINKTTE